jgi:hypothetical protein
MREWVMSIKSVSKLFLFSTLSMNVALAAPHDHGFYVEGNVGLGQARYSRFLDIFHTHDRYNSGSFAVNANAGYLWSKYFATEAGATIYGVRNPAESIDVAIKAILPFSAGSHDWSLFAKLGAQYITTPLHNEVGPLVGIGMSYSINDYLDFTAQANASTGLDTDAHLVSAGLTYHF